jgi:hypothetical protein
MTVGFSMMKPVLGDEGRGAQHQDEPSASHCMRSIGDR